MSGDNFGHLLVHRLNHRPDLPGVAALVLLRLLKPDAAIPGQSQGDMVAAGGFIRRIRHPALFNDGDPGGAAADIHHPGVIELQQIRHRGRLIQHMTDLQPGGLQDIDRNARIGAGRKRGRRMGEAAAQLLLESRKMSALEGDGAKKIPDDAVAHHVGPVKAYRNRLAVTVNHHRHHVAGAQIDAQPQRRLAGGGRLVTQGSGFL